ncbi:hypothetical protein V6O07_07380, partial [Arthrospira platensis SPKY2]
ALCAYDLFEAARYEAKNKIQSDSLYDALAVKGYAFLLFASCNTKGYMIKSFNAVKSRYGQSL